MNLFSIPWRIAAAARALLRRRALEREMQEEMAAHLARAAERLTARGLSPAEARDAARREFGNVGVLQEEARDARGARWLESVAADLRFAVRQIARRPLASTTIVCVLALGIGVHAALFDLLEANTVRVAPGVRRTPALVRLRGKEQPAEKGPWMPRAFSYPEYRDLAARRDLFARSAAWATDNVTLDLGDPDAATTAEVHFIAGSYFETAGVRVQLGRALSVDAPEGDGSGDMTAVISDALWRDQLGAAPDVIGRAVRLNDALVRIVGVAPPRFNGLVASGQTRTLWLPLAARAAVLRASTDALISRDSALLSAAALLAPGATIERASAVVRLLSDQAVGRMTAADDRRIRTADVVPLRVDTELPESQDALFISAVFGTGALLVLIVACTNVSALVVGAAITRRQEIAIRLSLGASRSRLVRQLLTESCVLSLCGGAVGLALYATLARVLAAAVPDLELTPGLGTAAFTMLIAMATGIVFGLSPALHATRRDVADALKSGNGSGGATAGSRLQSTFIVAQIAATQPLLVAMALVIILVARQGERPVDDGVSRHVIRMGFDLGKVSPAGRARLRAAMRDLETQPGFVSAVSDADGLGEVDLTVLPNSRVGLLRETSVRVKLDGASPGYFAVLDIPIVRGRDLVPADTSARDIAAVIGSDLARELWGTADPVGRRFSQASRQHAKDSALVVVGVFDATRATTRGVGRHVFAVDAGPWRDNAYLVRTKGPASTLTRAARARLRTTLPELPIARLETLAERMAELRRAVVLVGGGASVSGALVLLLGSIGLYGVVGLAVAQRRREIGIRVALGARPAGVVALFFRQGVRLSVIGLLIGLPLSIAVLTLIRQQIAGDGNLGDFTSSIPLIGAGIASTVLVVASIATWVPARRAAAVDPMTALRVE